MLGCRGSTLFGGCSKLSYDVTKYANFDDILTPFYREVKNYEAYYMALPLRLTAYLAFVL